MPVFTLVITSSSGEQHTTLSDFPDDKTAIGDVGRFVSAEHPSVALARDAGADAEFLGVWDWNEGQPCWSAEE